MLKSFQVDLKACLGLVLSNQCYPILIWVIFFVTGFLGEFYFVVHSHTFIIPTMNHEINS